MAVNNTHSFANDPSMSSVSLFRPTDHYNDIGHVNTNVTLQLNV